jgi:hypothetical protein
LAEKSFGFASHPHAADSFQWEERVVTGSGVFVDYPDAKPEATYLSDGACAYTIRNRGGGWIHSFGFDYGFGYGSREHLPVPRCYKKDNHYPLTVITRTPVDKWLVEAGLSRGRRRGVENILFANGRLLVNHTPYTVRVEKTKEACSTFEGFDGVHLPGRHAVFLPGVF